jgi:hypothetical protein
MRMENIWAITLATKGTFATTNMIWKNRMSFYRYVFHHVRVPYDTVLNWTMYWTKSSVES